MAEWLRLPPLEQQVDIEDLGSYHGGRQARLRLHFDHLEEGDEVDSTMARKNKCV